MKFTSASERGPYSRSKHGSFREEFNVEAHSKRKKWKKCCCRTIVCFVFFLLLLCVIGIIIYHVVKPKYPSVEMSNISITALKVGRKRHGLLFKALLSMNMTANLTAINPNHFRIMYSPTQANVTYKDMFIGNSTVPAIDQPAFSNHTMKVLLVMDRIDVTQGTGLSLLNDTARNAVPFTVMGTIRARVHFLGFTSSVFKVELRCNIVVHAKKTDPSAEELHHSIATNFCIGAQLPNQEHELLVPQEFLALV